MNSDWHGRTHPLQCWSGWNHFCPSCSFTVSHSSRGGNGGFHCPSLHCKGLASGLLLLPDTLRLMEVGLALSSPGTFLGLAAPLLSLSGLVWSQAAFLNFVPVKQTTPRSEVLEKFLAVHLSFPEFCFRSSSCVT